MKQKSSVASSRAGFRPESQAAGEEIPVELPGKGPARSFSFSLGGMPVKALLGKGLPEIFELRRNGSREVLRMSGWRGQPEKGRSRVIDSCARCDVHFSAELYVQSVR